MRPGMREDGTAAGLLTALLLGAGMGLLYDLLRPLRHRAGRMVPLLDIAFALLAGIGAFLFAMSAETGRLGLWDLTVMLLGFLLWLYFLSRFKQVCSWFLSWSHLKKDIPGAKNRQKNTSKN